MSESKKDMRHVLCRLSESKTHIKLYTIGGWQFSGKIEGVYHDALKLTWCDLETLVSLDSILAVERSTPAPEETGVVPESGAGAGGRIYHEGGSPQAPGPVVVKRGTK